MNRYKSLLIAILLLPILQMCTVGYSFTGADIPAQAKTFSVKTFQSATALAPSNYRQNISESLKDLLLSQTRLDLVERRGDLQYEGTVTYYEVGSAAISADETTSLNRLTIEVRVKYINTFDREKNFERNFRRYADFPSNQDINAVEASLIEEINEQLTQDIFDASLGAW